jgi:hypothetical protein
MLLTELQRRCDKSVFDGQVGLAATSCLCIALTFWRGRRRAIHRSASEFTNYSLETSKGAPGTGETAAPCGHMIPVRKCPKFGLYQSILPPPGWPECANRGIHRVSCHVLNIPDPNQQPRQSWQSDLNAPVGFVVRSGGR